LIPVHLPLVLIYGGLTAGPPIALGFLVDHLINRNMGFITSPVFLVAVLAFSALIILLGYLRGYFDAVISETASATFQLDLYRHLQKLGADFYQQNRVGEISSRLTNDINKGVKPFYSIVMRILWSAGYVVTAVVYLSFANQILFGLFTVFGLLVLAVAKFFVPKVEARYRALQDQYGDVNAAIIESINAHSLIRAFAREKESEKEITGHILDFRDKKFASEWYFWKFSIICLNYQFFLTPFLLLVVGSLFVGKGVTIGNLATAYTYWWLFSTNLRSLTTSFTNLFVSFAGFGRVLEFFDKTPLISDKHDAVPLRISSGAIRFDNVCFSYPARNDDFAIKNVSFSIPAHAKVALVGYSGGGKSSLVRLILRLYDVAGGSIAIDGQDISNVTQRSLRSQIGVVMQDTMLLDGSFRTNMSFVKKDVSEPEIIRALERARLWDFVRELPDGLDTVIGEKGLQLSGGQRQRIAIARVFLLEPAIVILDEATSSLDASTERAVMDTMKELLVQKTALVIAHRIGTVVDADQIVVIDKGEISAIGKHEQLFETSDYYRSICKEQLVEKTI
jgi:subfamily B ATP-binding cassette protein MsbA